MIAFFSWMKRVCTWTALLGLVSESPMPYSTCLPSTPLLPLSESIIAAMPAPLLMCSKASS